ncbi:hypothetical protein MVEG_11378 [Podila verticillata NRRL 6337]|uniref:Uncharacterized protein n=1 Tax=Podila verticillata NRRL 6337 TaxID=1069443 RepID=A0A086TLM6_9FUNG|nr:hypothetical protein MVEG_11378 [Podila verticillata NRRL 6337]
MKIITVLAAVATARIASAALFECSHNSQNYMCQVQVGEQWTTLQGLHDGTIYSKCTGDGAYCWNVISYANTVGADIHVSVTNNGAFCSFDMTWGHMAASGIKTATKRAC